MLGTNIIHSPSSTEGTPWKHKHVHGGATKNAPPDMVIFQLNDTTNITVGARTIYEKKNFGGILFPIFPIFWLPKIDYYEEQPNSLIIELSTWNNDTNFQVKSATIKSNSKTYELQETTITDVETELRFPLSAEQTSEFELTNLSLTVNGELRNLPSINFRKMKQRWRFIGP